MALSLMMACMPRMAHLAGRWRNWLDDGSQAGDGPMSDDGPLAGGGFWANDDSMAISPRWYNDWIVVTEVDCRIITHHVVPTEANRGRAGCSAHLGHATEVVRRLCSGGPAAGKSSFAA